MLRAERDEVARRHLEAAESWLRRLVHVQLAAKFGLDYLTSGGVLETREARSVASTLSSLATGARQVDGTTFGQLIKIAVSQKLYLDHFAEALKECYPLGAEEAEFFLNQLRDIRNGIAHGRGVSDRNTEKAVCYSNDLADAIKSYFRGRNLEREYNVPLIIRYSDSLGNESHLEGLSLDLSTRIIDWRRAGKGDLYPGDRLVVEVEVDPSFDRSSYKAKWNVLGKYAGSEDLTAEITITNDMVGEQFEIAFEVRSTRDWHRMWGMDDRLALIFRVLPPQAQ